MQSITIARFEEDPTAQGVIKPADGSWQLVLDKDGIPHLYVQVDVEETPGEPPTKGLLCIEDVLDEGLSIRDLMRGGTFEGTLSPEEEEKAVAELAANRAENPIPCPR